jgi:hypothetical protein
MSRTRVWLGIAVAVLLLLGSRWQSAAEAQSEATQSVAGGGVTVAATFLKQGSDGPAFRVVLDTHSVNLDGYRFEEVVRLRDGKGGERAPTAVENPQGGGHHRSATVRFAWPEPRPKSLELVVKGVAGVPERLFQWTLE